MNIIVFCGQLVETPRAAPTLLRRTVSVTRARRGKASACLFCLFSARAIQVVKLIQEQEKIITVEPRFRRHPWDNSKCPLNRYVS